MSIADRNNRTIFRIIALSTVILAGSACRKSAATAGPATPPIAEKNAAIQLGERFKIHSNVLGQERAYWVHLPETYPSGHASSTSYPVLYVLDGEAHFESVVATVDFLSGFAMIPEMIVVAVLNTDRMHDLTPTHTDKGAHGKIDPRIANSGGGDAFEGFLRTELIPKIESTYATMPFRVLIGHSLSGLLSLHAALGEPPTFQAIIAMDPSLWWDGQMLVKQAAARLPSPPPPLKSIYLSTGAQPLDNGEDSSEGRAATRAFAEILTRSVSPTFRSKVQIFEHENHQSVAFPSIYDGLLFTFEGYKMPTSEALEDISRIAVHYKNLSAKFGVEWRPPQRLIDLVSYSLLFERHQLDDAIRLLGENAKAYPNSAAAHDHLGRAYLMKGDKVSAMRCFERALELDPSDDETRSAIVKLRNE